MKFSPAIFTLLACLMPISCSKDTQQVSPSNDADISTIRESEISDRALLLLQKMTLEEKIGQIIQADISAVTPEQARDYNLGSVLNGGNSAPGGGKTADPEAWVALADAFWDASTDTSDGGVGIALLWGTDAVHGHNNLQTATLFPHNSALGATHNPDLMRKIGDVTAREIRATGLDWTFAPTLAVARDDRWGRAYESYSENPELVAQYASAIIEGLQGIPGEDDFLVGDNVMATAKHFIGDGGTQQGIDKGDTIADLDELIRIHGAGYQPAIDAHVQSVMSSFSSVNGKKMHGSHYFLTEVLRDQMSFEGFVVGDWNGHGEVPGCSITDCPQSLLAGLDMYMAPDSWEGLYNSLLEEAQNGTLDLNRLDEAVTRILKVKIRSGLLDAGRPSERSTTDVSILGRPDHRAIARQAVRESQTLLKNQNNILPIKPRQKVLVTGSGANSMQQQTGGWTLNWQGTGNANEEFKTGETIYSGLSKAVKDIGGTTILSVDGSYSERPDVAIIVYGEQPYAEYRGDRSDLVFEFSAGENLQLINKLRADNIPVISVFLTGRPLWVNPHLNVSDAFVVAWLPGSEGGGIADILIADTEGNPRYDFTGKLSFSWPSDGIGLPINAPNNDGVLYPYGYGLTYADGGSEFIPLSEDPGIIDSANNFDGQLFARGEPASAFSIFIGDSSNLNVPVNALTASSLGGGIKISGTDYKAQEDARLIEWSGNGKATFGLKSKRAIDLTDFIDTDKASISIIWRVAQDADDQLSMTMGCGDGCGATLNIDSLTHKLDDDEWVETTIPLVCFTQNGLDPEHLTDALNITSKHNMAVAIFSAQITQGETIIPNCALSQ